MKSTRLGVSLLEILLSMTILGIAILALIGLFTSGLKLQTQSEKVTVATELGRSFLEELKGGGFSRLPITNALYDGRQGDPPDSTLGFPPIPYPSAEIGGVVYSLVVDVRENGTNRLSIQVQVWWDENSHVSLESSFVP